MLFLELALIRWLGANVVHLSYFSNFVLLGSFLGIGLGFLISRHSWSILPAAPVILALLVIFTYLEPVTIDRAGDQIIYFTSLSTTGPAGLAGAADDLRPGRGRAWPVRPRWSAAASATCGR